MPAVASIRIRAQSTTRIAWTTSPKKSA